MHTLRTSLLLCMLIYINYAGSEALSLLNQMKPKFKEESDLGTEDLIYKKVTEQLKQQQPHFDTDEEETKNEVSFREFYKNVRSGKHELVDDEEINIIEPEHKEIQIQSYLQELSDGLEPQTETIAETEIQTDPEKLGKFKKYFIKEDENKQQVNIETNIENSNPIEKKMTLREKLEMKKKQAQQPPVLAAIQIKQEVDNQEQVADQNVGKTTLIKKIEEFKKMKQSKDTKETQQETQQENQQEQTIKSVPENPLRKLLNKKAEERKEQELNQQIEQNKLQIQTQEAEIELKQIDAEDIPFDQNTDNEQNIDNQSEQKESSENNDETINQQEQDNDDTLNQQEQYNDDTIYQQDQDNVESQQENKIQDENDNDASIQQQQQIESDINPNIDPEIQEDQTIIDDESQRFQQDSEGITNTDYDQQQQHIANEKQINSNEDQSQVITSENYEQEIVNNNDQDQQMVNDNDYEIVNNNDHKVSNNFDQNIDNNNDQEIVNNNDQEQQQYNNDQEQQYSNDQDYQNNDLTNQEIQQENQEFEAQEQQQSQYKLQQQEIQTDNQQQNINDDDYNQDQQQNQNVDDYNYEEQQNMDQDQNLENQQESSNINTSKQGENNDIINEEKVENTLSEGFVMENNVENSDYLEDVQDAEIIQKKREVEEMIEEEERIKQKLELKELDDEKKLNELEEQEKLLINEKEQEQKEIEEVQKQIDQDYSQLKDIEKGGKKQQDYQENELKQEDNQEVEPLQEALQEDLNISTDIPLENQKDQQKTQNQLEQNTKQEEKVEPLESKPVDGSIQLQDETLENGFNIDEYQRLQHQSEDKSEQDTTNYSQSSELYHKNEYITQIKNDQQDQVIQQSEPTLSIDKQTNFKDQDVQYQPKIQITQEISTGDNQDLTQSNQEQEGLNTTKDNQLIEEKNPNSDQQENTYLDNQIESTNGSDISNESTSLESKIDVSNETHNLSENQQDQQSLQQQENQIQDDDTPSLIPVDESENLNPSYKFDLKLDNEENEIVQLDDSNSFVDDEIKNAAQEQQIDPTNTQLLPNPDLLAQNQFQDTSNVLSANKLHSNSQIQQSMQIDYKIKIENIDVDIKEEQQIQENILINQNRQQASFLQVEKTDIDQKENQFEILISQKKEQGSEEKKKKRRKQKRRKQKQRKLQEEQFQQILQQKQQQEILKQQQQLIELQNQQLLNKQKYKMATKQNNQVIIESKPIKRDNFIHLQKQQSQIQLINQQIDTEFSFQQIISKVEKEERQGQKQLRSNTKHVKNADLNFFQLTEKQQQNKISLQSQDLFEAIKQEIKECDLNNYTINLCQLCQSDVVYEINDDNWYLIGIAYGLKRHFQNLLNTVQYHFKNSKIYTSFNKEQQVCLTLGDQFEIENLEDILNYYNNQTLPKNSQFLRIPQKIKANFAQMKVDLNQHKFMNFSLNAAIKIQENYNGFTVSEQYIKISNDFDYSQQGNIFYPGQSIPYKLIVQSNGIENMQLDLNPQIYEKVLESFLAKNYLQQIQVTYRDNLNSNFVVVDNEDLLEIEITIQK
ncbi:unnamed protein product (macronuclear) [Paramecium tetraurelia]|uniref:Uncharacterized protein n=1 Tax=Paramecium tetraurelia TaxID=5888 RepID=A0DTB8_PARTE|nr:uncharacterized protein GSPATT00019978001 [Paramecium tetraurelia]CAK86285.1 unnamed protein product [Paramecium tetraurelia]|eukprot:XP_001453682.1 hypothetical protein (macronuclear) [Paramecium tetraurelia strain d4-2]